MGLDSQRDKAPKLLYHYCSGKAFESIVKSKSIWLSDLRNSNDAYEGIAMVKAIESLAYKEGLPLLERDEVIQTARTISDSSLHFGTCFTMHEDRLGQWRGYANWGKGVAIDFPSKVLARQSFPEISTDCHKRIRTHLCPVVYKTVEELDHLFRETYLQIKEICRKEYPSGVWGMMKQTVEMLNITVPDPELYRIKRDFWKEEKEWRLVALHHPCSELGFSPAKPEQGKARYVCSLYESILCGDGKYMFRTCSEPIQKVVLGPLCESSEEEVQALLRDNGFNNVDVAYSEGKAMWVEDE
ncbi:MAG: DUF2971 domain-containing protein [Kiritimatiellales bacterium]|nr:DUF2971 domain-containing protein [Kiritimatiellales bacterium]MCF7863354.1 DUF2971 domain-containing protein [Kiritimatiellales bacterium]